MWSYTERVKFENIRYHKVQNEKKGTKCAVLLIGYLDVCIGFILLHWVRCYFYNFPHEIILSGGTKRFSVDAISNWFGIAW